MTINRSCIILQRFVTPGGNVDYLSRRHFFSDWFTTAPRNARDVTPDISPDYAVADKQLNRKPDGGSISRGWAFIPVK